ncbi:MAG: TolB family protein [Chloroflexota bacterium]
MKKQSFNLIFVIALGLSSCYSGKNSESYNTTVKNDYLVYLTAPQIGEPQLTLYDPANNKHTQVLTITRRDNSFSLSKDNRLAFAKDGNVYIWNYPFTANTPTEITFDEAPTAEKTVLSWSSDGRYLLLTEAQADSKKLLLWDGKNFSEIYNPQREIYFYRAKWSNNGELAFTEYFIDNTSWKISTGETFIWDGKDVVNFSKNPSMYYLWSEDGQLAFLSYQDGEYKISVWDGKSKNHGAPNIKTVIIPDVMVSPASNLTWTRSGSIVFIGHGKTDSHTQVYEWDGQTARNVSQTPSRNNYGVAWRNDGYWSAYDNFTMYVRDNANQTILETKGATSRWTQSGLLVFCKPNGINWTLSVWNGKSIVDITDGDYILAKWTNSNGESILCTFG